MIDYFFSGNQYIRVGRAETGPGSVNPGYPAPISNWGWKGFGANGIDAALYSGSKCYFFSGNQYIRMTRGVVGPGTVDPGYPAPISNWGWKGFGATGIDAALNSGGKCYFFKGNEYIRVTRGETGPGTVDSGYPAPISNWGWKGFGASGIDAALYSGSKCYFFKGNEYIRVTRGEVFPGTVDPGYPAPISNWGWKAFGANGIKAALYSGGPLATPPSAGLKSNSNYFLNNCSNITGLTVTININGDMKSDIGFGFQLNAYSATHDNADAAQQYVILCDSGGILWGWVDNWTSANKEVINHREVIATLPSATLPAGYVLQITLANDSSDRISGATYEAFNASGASIGSVTLTLTSLKKDDGTLMTDADLAPITAFQLDIVGPYSGEMANLSSGLGTITYTASVNMAVGATEPSCVDWDYETLEQANTVYDTLPAAESTQFAQYFEVTSAGIARAKQRARVAHMLRVPK
jgi:hypothetical protein